jgi:type I restriction-modification system DNA methylase subunit
MAVPQTVQELIERFNRNRTAYRSEQYNEAQLRVEFLNPFFEALGWDVNNKQGYAQAYKDVVNEDAIKVGGATKAPDYAFRIGGTRKFFVEAKKPAINLRDASEPAFQLRRYAWPAKLPLSILTDFEEFVVYDCRVKPDRTDKATTARLMYLPYTDYLQRWEELAAIFSREAILKGSFDTYAEETKGKRGTAEVDTAFLQEIESWRELLARHLAQRNKNLTQRELNFAVQMTIDRIIFLRICEDRGIEDYERLRALLKGTTVYTRLCNLFSEADDRYNSGLFHFQKEKDVPEPPDTLTPHLILDDKPLKEIITRLYYPESPYEFSALPADVLGQVYEQFLGKVIRLLPSHQVMVEEKPEVRKAGGVYYTPTFIVDYIVRQTLSKLLVGKKPGPRGSASKIKIVDPACGSGSFLIVAYQYLLDWHRDRYVEDGVEKHRKELYQGKGGLWLLTTQEKKRILLNSIYGVDIDSQAVEVTKLSLLLKVLEGESSQSLSLQLRLFHERALPDLDSNIKCGNSLIGPDFYNIAQVSFLDEEERYRINVFDWMSAFPQVFSDDDPGFDAVVGNPPYGYMIPSIQQEYFSKHYKHQDYQKDYYLLFLEKYEHLLKRNGLLGVIVSNTWLQSVTLRKIRQYLTTSYRWLRILHLPEKVFRAVIDTHVLIFQRAESGLAEMGEVCIDIRRRGVISKSHTLPWQIIPRTGDPINVVTPIEVHKLFQRIRDYSFPLVEFCKVYNGAKPFEVGKGNPPQTVQIQKAKPYVVEGAAPDATWSPLLRGSLIQRYMNLWNHNYWIQYGPWLAAPRDPEIFKAPLKIVVRQTGDTIIATLVERGCIARDNLHILLPRDSHINLLYILGLMNSRLMDFAYTFMNPEKGEAMAQVKKQQVEQLPIRRINFSDPNDKARHDRVVELVTHMLSLNKRLIDARMPHDKTILQQQINVTDRQIDRLVYDLYSLTEVEIKLVEEQTSVKDISKPSLANMPDTAYNEHP